MTQSAHTRCWGVLLAFGLQLPVVPPPSPPAGQSVPPPVTRPAADPWAAAWNHTVTSTPGLHLALSRDFVFVAGPETPLEARAAETGDVVWRHTLTSWQALSAADTLVLGISGDHAYALEASTGRTRWVTEITGPNTQLLVDGRHLLMMSDHDLLLREVDSGTPLWRAGLTAPPAAPAAFGSDLIAVAQQDGTVLALERLSGVPRWRRTLTSVPQALTTATPLVYAGLANGTFCALNERNGSERWCFSLRVPVSGPPVVDGDVVRVALLDNSLRSFHRLNGSMVQQGSLGHRPAAGPWLTGPTLVIALTTGQFVVMDRASSRILARLSTSDSTGLLERSAVSSDRGLLASLTMDPGGERRLSVYRPRPAAILPIMPLVMVLPPGGAVTLGEPPPPAVTPDGRPPSPRPFPAPR